MKNIVVIGGGPGGYSAAIYCADLGMKVTLIEKQHIGGTCLNVGCIPTKAFVQASRVYSQALDSEYFGVKVNGEVSVDFGRTLKYKNKTVRQLRSGVSYLLQKAGVNVISGTGKIINASTVRVETDAETYDIEADDIIIATGSSEVVVPGFEFDGVKILNSTQMLDMDKMPESLAIIGGGVIGVEFASILKAFGKEVTIIEMCPSILPNEDEQISRELEKELKSKGVNILVSAQADKILEKNEAAVTIQIKNADGEIDRLTVERVLVCVGRKPNLDGIGLEEAGIKFNRKFIETNERMQTSIKNIYAAGDVTKSPMLAHVAYYESKIAALNIAGKESRAEYNAVPGWIFSNPEVARVGMTEKEAREKIKNIDIAVDTFNGNGKAMIERENQGFIKIIYNKDNGVVVGCSIIGPKATELITQPTLGITYNLTVRDFSESIYAHPSLSEIIGEAANAAIGLNLHS